MQKRFGKKEALLQAAMEEFSLQYYDQASLNTILQHSGVGKGNFYYHFKNKEQLYEAVAVLLAQKKLQFFSARPEAAEAESLPLFAKFRLLGELSELFTCSDPVIEGLIFHITTEPSAAARRISERALGSGSRSYFLDLVEDARRRIRSDPISRQTSKPSCWDSSSHPSPERSVRSMPKAISILKRSCRSSPGIWMS